MLRFCKTIEDNVQANPCVFMLAIQPKTHQFPKKEVKWYFIPPLLCFIYTYSGAFSLCFHQKRKHIHTLTTFKIHIDVKCFGYPHTRQARKEDTLLNYILQDLEKILVLIVRTPIYPNLWLYNEKHEQICFSYLLQWFQKIYLNIIVSKILI